MPGERNSKPFRAADFVQIASDLTYFSERYKSLGSNMIEAKIEVVNARNLKNLNTAMKLLRSAVNAAYASFEEEKQNRPTYNFVESDAAAQVDEAQQAADKIVRRAKRKKK